MDEYRIRWAVVEVCNGYTCWKERRCLAQKIVKFLWLFPMWWPVDGADWRRSEAEAERDIARDVNLLRPLPPSKHFRGEA